MLLLILSINLNTLSPVLNLVVLLLGIVKTPVNTPCSFITRLSVNPFNVDRVVAVVFPLIPDIVSELILPFAFAKVPVQMSVIANPFLIFVTLMSIGNPAVAVPSFIVVWSSGI